MYSEMNLKEIHRYKNLLHQLRFQVNGYQIWIIQDQWIKIRKKVLHTISIQLTINFLKYMELTWLQGEILRITNIPEYLI